MLDPATNIDGGTFASSQDFLVKEERPRRRLARAMEASEKSNIESGYVTVTTRFQQFQYTVTRAGLLHQDAVVLASTPIIGNAIFSTFFSTNLHVPALAGLTSESFF